jgi:hypothetical protein
MLTVFDLAALDPGTAYWVPAVEAPMRDWPPVPGCRRGARFLVSADGGLPALSGFPAFDSRAECLRWILAHQGVIAGARVHAARLDAWILGIDSL